MRPNVVGVLCATALTSAACHSLRPVPLDALGGLRPSRVWVTRADQTVVVVSGPRTFGDTLVGYINGQFEEMPAADFKRISVKQAARGKTFALIAASAVAAGAVAYLITNTGSYVDPATKLDCDDNPEQPGCPGYIP